MAKDFSKPYYNSQAWIRTRDAYMASVGGLCEDCLVRGVYTAGKIVHHIIPLTPENINDPRITLDWKNLKLVCQDCHAMEHKSWANRRFTVDANGHVTPPLLSKNERTLQDRALKVRFRDRESYKDLGEDERR